ncbi:MAG: hypothetical protein AAF206_23755 [Bacteroidota bacterium]
MLDVFAQKYSFPSGFENDNPALSGEGGIGTVSAVFRNMRIGWILLLIFFLPACAGNRIGQKGVSFVKVGDAMPSRGLNTWENFAVRDTLFDEENYQWPGLMVQTDRGQILVEGDFDGGKTVNRIRIESPDYLGPGKVHVGMSFSDLKRHGKSWDVIYLAAYRLVDVINPKKPGIHYLIEASFDPSSFDPDTFKANDLPDTAKIVAIVVM